MSLKPISPKMHGLFDYAFTAVQWVAPHVLNFNPKAKKLYTFLGTNLLAYNMITDHPVALKRVVPYRTHKTIDVTNVIGLAALTLYSGIRKDKKALPFHIGFVTLAAINILLTDWNAATSER